MRDMRSPIAVLLAMALACPGLSFAAESDGTTPPEVVLHKRGDGWLITDAGGMTLYTFTKDQEPGKSACVGRCANTWHPLVAAPTARDNGDWSTLVREDGSRQWTFRRHPLYRYTGDVSAGDMNGNDIEKQWHIAIKPIVTPPGVGIYKTQYGQLLVDAKNMTLYASDGDKADASACNGACARTWRPLRAPWMARAPDADWSIVKRVDGTTQWAFRKKPIYTFQNDILPGQAKGIDVDRFHAIVLEPPPPIPDWVTFQQSDAGEVMADPDGKTMYAHEAGLRRIAGRYSGPDDGIERPFDWRPVLAAPNAKPTGEWGFAEPILPHDAGARQWTWRGMLLYVNVRDKRPGDTNGIRSMDRVWRPIMTNGLTMPGVGN